MSEPDLFSYPNTPGWKEETTSRDAAIAIESTAQTIRGEALRELQNRAGTADEVAARIGRSILAVRPRITELKLKGLISRTEERRPNASGMNAIVWRAINARP